MGSQHRRSDFRAHARRAAELVFRGAQIPSNSMGFAEAIAEAHREIGLAADCEPSDRQLRLLYEASTLLHPDSGLRSTQDLRRAYNCLRTAAASTFWTAVWQFITLPFSVVLALVKVLERLVTRHFWKYAALWIIAGVVVVAVVWNQRSDVPTRDSPTAQSASNPLQVIPTQTPVPALASPQVLPTQTPVPLLAPPRALPPQAEPRDPISARLAQIEVESRIAESEADVRDLQAWEAAAQPVVRVVDGDTLDVWFYDQVERVRLLKVDTPERGCPLFDAATAFVRERVEGKRVALRFAPGSPGRDSYGRLLAEVQIQREGRVVDLGSELLDAGLAVPYVPGGPDCLPPG